MLVCVCVAWFYSGHLPLSLLASESAAHKRREFRAESGSMTAPAARASDGADDVTARMAQLTTEIEERQEFIAGMREAGQSKAHEGYIEAEINTRLRELQQLMRDDR